MEKLYSRERSRSQRNSSPFFAREGRRGPRLVVVLDKTDELTLIGEIGTEMKSDALRVVVR